jgi:hypothetical protein
MTVHDDLYIACHPPLAVRGTAHRLRHLASGLLLETMRGEKDVGVDLKFRATGI